MWFPFWEKTTITFLNDSCRHQHTDYKCLQASTCGRHQSPKVHRNQPVGDTNPIKFTGTNL